MAAYSEGGDPIALAECGDNVVQLHSARKRQASEIVSFDRKELDGDAYVPVGELIMRKRD